MSNHRRIVGNEALLYSPGRLSPAVGAMHLYPEQNRLRRAFGWMRWWHWAALFLALVLVIDARVL
jgi:hypothetical protein